MDDDSTTSELGRSLLRRDTEPGLIRRPPARPALGGSTLAADIFRRWTPGATEDPGTPLVYASAGRSLAETPVFPAASPFSAAPAPPRPAPPEPIAFRAAAPSPASAAPSSLAPPIVSRPIVSRSVASPPVTNPAAPRSITSPPVAEMGPAILRRRPSAPAAERPQPAALPISAPPTSAPPISASPISPAVSALPSPQPALVELAPVLVRRPAAPVQAPDLPLPLARRSGPSTALASPASPSSPFPALSVKPAAPAGIQEVKDAEAFDGSDAAGADEAGDEAAEAEELAERVMRQLARALAVERERRGGW